ncbi:MAG: methyltransferase [Gemmatimonas sp.]
MSTHASAASADVEHIRSMVTGFARTQELYVAVSLRIPEMLVDGPRSATALATECRAHATSLHRLLRKLAVHQVLFEESNGDFRLLPAGHLLRRDDPNGLASLVLWLGDVNYRAQAGLLRAVQTGQTAFDQIFGESLFSYLERHPETSAHFQELMQSGIADRLPAILSAFDFSSSRSIVDVGGGTGLMLSAILDSAPHAHGAVFDAPHLATDATVRFQSRGLASRAEFVPGDFFSDSVPVGADVYVLSNILHDWDDARAEQVLRNIRTAMHPQSAVLVIQELVPNSVLEAPSVAGSDLSMLVLTGGRERTEREYQDLLERARLKITTIMPIASTQHFLGRAQRWAILVGRAVPR